MTFVFGAAGHSIYAGAELLTMAERVEAGPGGPTIVFKRASGEKEELRLDEEVRAARAAGLAVAMG